MCVSSVFDVTKGKAHYGLGGGYHHFAGRLVFFLFPRYMLTASPKTLSKYFYEKPDFLTVHNIHLRLIQVEQCVSVSSQLFSISMANCSVNNYMVFFLRASLILFS